MSEPTSPAAAMRRPIVLGVLIAFVLVTLGVLALGGDLSIAIAAGVGVGLFVGGGIGLLWAARAASPD